jgi:hypothetical protein
MRRPAGPARRPALTRAATLAAAVALAITAARPTPAQEIVRSEVLDLATLEVQVTVAGALPSDRVQCLLRDAAGQVRVAGAQPVGTGATAGSATVLSIPLPHLAPTEREFAVSLVRADRELDRTVWRPVPRRP